MSSEGHDSSSSEEYNVQQLKGRIAHLESTVKNLAFIMEDWSDLVEDLVKDFHAMQKEHGERLSDLEKTCWRHPKDKLMKDVPLLNIPK